MSIYKKLIRTLYCLVFLTMEYLLWAAIVLFAVAGADPLAPQPGWWYILVIGCFYGLHWLLKKANVIIWKRFFYVKEGV